MGTCRLADRAALQGAFDAGGRGSGARGAEAGARLGGGVTSVLATKQRERCVCGSASTLTHAPGRYML